MISKEAELLEPLRNGHIIPTLNTVISICDYKGMRNKIIPKLMSNDNI